MPYRRPPNLTLTNWDLGGRPSAWAYLQAGELFPATEIPAPPQPIELHHAERPETARFAVHPGTSLDEYVSSEPVSGIVIVLDGQIVFERYPRMRPGDRHLLMSVTKVFTSAIVGILERRGVLDLAQPVDTVIGELADSGWAGVAGHDVLNMTSGIDCLEIDSPGAYTDPGHPHYRFETSLGWRPAAGEPDTYALVASLPSHRQPGQVYEYASVNTFVLSWLVERVTGLSFAEVLGREIWSRGGFEAPAQLCTSAAGAPASHGGISTTLRDLARFGMLFTPSGGLIADGAVIDDEHLRRIQTAPALRRPPNDLPDEVTAVYGGMLPPPSRQWNFVMEDGDLFKSGFGGQGLYVSPSRDLVIAFAGTPRLDGSVNQLGWFSRRLALAFG
jgi:CubicO group peptidase (beta-lactamase class C family)